MTETEFNAVVDTNTAGVLLRERLRRGEGAAGICLTAAAAEVASADQGRWLRYFASAVTLRRTGQMCSPPRSAMAVSTARSEVISWLIIAAQPTSPCRSPTV